ncbi:response regulator transcription factor [Paenibacillus hunanensis]|uniref:Two-component system alkaline phosphatase synthesis response regulator PhoP n=1 Tax=Paenibacillus hunanensis TaxID=539262 RepID=A0ABU1IV85_9BACL|nr:response regulator transcription factor [Paenibacillus hunanensis]MCL9662717.1 response regulator transcription factor [Paenibacillus hunanensis]MDR6242123.1 two-component system alkaline phosphatase synthesis response regulator PhoP [Paenibacillus hunanensis]WPP43502.1 response regulator transcription factor [Paenibacillus hunanensis]GGJ05383.1 DNA-binding response regulator [Paenibacillus hunanensis]
MNKAKILIIEDDAPIADLLSYGLSMEGFQTRIASSGAAGMSEVQTFQPDLLLLDWMLPDGSGLDICKKVTAHYNIPIMMITAKSDITDKILGLEFGADDYITKPFDLREVIARIRTILRRIDQATKLNIEQMNEEVIQYRHLKITEAERLVTSDDQPVELTPKEYDLLLMLIKNQGKTFTRSELLDLVWGYHFAGDTRTVDTHIQRLRKKLDANECIATVFGIGYKFQKTGG